MLFLCCDRRICCAGGVQKPKQFSECLECSFFIGVLWLGLGTPQALRRDCTQCWVLYGAPRSTPTLTELTPFQTYTHTHTHTADSVEWRCPHCEWVYNKTQVNSYSASVNTASCESFSNAYLSQYWTESLYNLLHKLTHTSSFGSVYSCLIGRQKDVWLSYIIAIK